MKISIVILNWNGKKDTLECLSSLKNLTYKEYDIIVVDNGSSDGSPQEIASAFPEALLLCQDTNLGFAGGCNVGIRYALDKGAEAICLLNNDAVVDPHFLSALAEKARKEPQTGILGAQILMYSDRERLDHLGGMWNAKRAAFDLIGNRTLCKDLIWDESQEIDYVCGASFFVKREVFEKVGLLEEKFFLIWEEADLCFQARRQGFSIKVCLEAKIFHKVSASFKSKAHSTYFFFRNRLLWMKRNLPPKEYERIYQTILFPEIRHNNKMLLLKSVQALIQRVFLQRPLSRMQKEKMLKYKAVRQAYRDYKEERYGQGPLWIYQTFT